MNIHQLLSTSQSSPQLSSQGVFGQQDSANGLFRQALAHASGNQGSAPSVHGEPRTLQTPQLQAQLEALASHLAEALAGGHENLSEALEELGIDVSEQDLSALLAQLQIPTSDTTTELLATGGAESLTPLDEIASRLALMSSFSDNSTSLKATESTDLESIADHLDISQSEASQLVAALSALVSQNQNAPPVLTSTGANAVEMDILQRPQTGHFFSQINTRGQTPQISSEALMGAITALDSSPKASQPGESLLTGLSLNANQAPLASAQTAPMPVATPTPATLSAPVTSPAWPQQLGQQLVQISQRGGEQHVQLQLNPAELGPLSISLKFGEQGAQAHFLSGHAQVRQILEQAIPQLREALAEQGISLGETSVGEQRDPNAQAFAESGNQQGTGVEGSNGDTQADETAASVTEGAPVSLDGRVDIYA